MDLSMINHKSHGTSDVCRQVGISLRQLEYWILIGIVIPGLEKHGLKSFKRFSERDIDILMKVKSLTDEGFMVSRALEKVKRDNPALFMNR